MSATVGVMELGTVLICLGVMVVLYGGFVLALLVLGRRSDARALAGFIPDCLILFKRLLGDSRVRRSARSRSQGWSSTSRCHSIWCPTSCRWPVSWTTRSWSRSPWPWSFAAAAARSSMSTGRVLPRGPT